VLASIVSLWWHTESVNSAGASGAVFGVYGLFLALLTTNLIPKKVRNVLLQSIGIFIGYNLLYGMKGGVDNAAHIGGLVSGFIFGYIYAFDIKKENAGQQLNWVMPLIILSTIGISYEYLHLHRATLAERNAQLAYMDAAGFKDNEKFTAIMQDFYALQDKAVAPIDDTTLTFSDLKPKIDSISYPSWIQAETELISTKTFDISPAMHKEVDRLLQYISLRKNELDVLNKMVVAGNEPELISELNEVRHKINVLLAATE
jgi:rhomboid protease GluP